MNSASNAYLQTGRQMCLDENTICTIVINWNGWQDTIICLKSLFLTTTIPTRIIVCDNGSTDQSISKISNWLRDEITLKILMLSTENAETKIVKFEITDNKYCGLVKSIHLIGLPTNLGYAGALNCGILFGREFFPSRGYWLLNNDIKVEPDALMYLVRGTCAVPDLGLCGSVLMDWDRPEFMQAIGGIFQIPLAVGRHLTDLPPTADRSQEVFFAIDYPVGASLFVTHEYLETVGLMDDSYFLYYEEMDWAERGRLHGFRPAVALRSRVQHKEGASTGSHGGVRNKSLLSERYGVINRLRITRKFWPWYLPIVWLSLWLVVIDRTVHGEWARAELVLRLMFAPEQWLQDRKLS